MSKKNKKSVYLQYIIPVVLIAIATLVKFYAIAGFGYKIPYLLYFLVIAICGIYFGIRSAAMALLSAMLFSFSIYLVPEIYKGIPANTYILPLSFFLIALLLTMVIVSRLRVNLINKEKEEQFKFLADAIPEKIWTADKTGKANYYNQEWYEYTGYKTFQELHDQVWLLIHPDDLKKAETTYSKYLLEGTSYETEVRIKASDGNYRWHLNRTKPKKDSQGNIVLWIGICIDVHDQKLVADAIKESERQSNELLEKMDEFISIASHELKTPIASIQGYLQIMERLVNQNNEKIYIDFLAKARKQLTKLSALIQDLLDVSKIQEGKMQFNFTKFIMSELVQEVIESVSTHHPSHQFEIRTNNNQAMVTADRFRMEQVLSNLLSNAVKYSPDANKVIVDFSMVGNKMQVAVTDFGIGIPEKNKQYIFNRFYRVEDTSYKFTGLGIGLYICSEIINRHQGEIWFTSELDKGSTFSFTIPAERSQ